MRSIHVECLPDEIIVRCLGKSAKMITHHTGKSRIMSRLKATQNAIALTDEDPLSAKHPHERTLQVLDSRFGLKVLKDNSLNKVVLICPRLEEWLIKACVDTKIDITNFGLPNSGNELHKVINQRLLAGKKLINFLIEQNSPAITFLQRELE